MAVMNANEILRRGATTAQPNQFNLALPKLPTAVQTYTPYTQMDPANYIANVAGFLPVNVQHIGNTTNGYAYNSLADVVFNYKAWQKRWGEDSWLNTPIGYIPRVVADTGLLLKDTIVDPVVDSVKLATSNPNDNLGLLKGLSAGINTAVLNTLVNAGGTLDALSNPVKGLVLDGPEGFVRGSIGMEDGGRKQYDYMDYLDFGSGFVAGAGEFVTSLVLEFASDPMTWLSFGITGAAKSGSKTLVDEATDIVSDVADTLSKRGVKAVASESIEASADNALDQTVKQVTKYTLDDGTDAIELVKNIAASKGRTVSDKTAAGLLKDIVTSDGVNQSAVSKIVTTAKEQLPDQVQKIVTRSDIPLAKLPDQLRSKNVLQRLAFQSDNGVALTPAQQNYFADLINIDKLPGTLHLSKGLQNFEKGVGDVTRYGLWASSAMLPLSLAKKGVGKLIKSSAAKRNLIKMAQAAANTTQFLDSTDKAINFDGDIVTLTVPKRAVSELPAHQNIVEGVKPTVEVITKGAPQLNAPETIKGLPEVSAAHPKDTGLITITVDPGLHEHINRQIDDVVSEFRNTLYNGKTYITPSEFKALREECVGRINQIFLKNNFDTPLPFSDLQTYINYLKILNNYNAPQYIKQLSDKFDIINKWFVADITEDFLANVSQSMYARATKVIQNISAGQGDNLKAAEEARAAAAHLLKYHDVERDVNKEWVTFGNLTELSSVGFEIHNNFSDSNFFNLFYEVAAKQSEVYAGTKHYVAAGDLSLAADTYDISGAGVFDNQLIDQECMTFLSSKQALAEQDFKFRKVLKELGCLEQWDKAGEFPSEDLFKAHIKSIDDKRKILDAWYDYTSQAERTAQSYLTLHHALVKDAEELATAAARARSTVSLGDAYKRATARLPDWDISITYLNTVDVNDIIKHGLVGYGLMYSKRSVLKDLLQNYGNLETAQGYTKLLMEYTIPDSPLYKTLHSPEYKNNPAVLGCIKCFDNVAAYIKLTQQVEPLLQGITEWHKQGIMDALVTALSKYNAFDERHIEATIQQMLDTADLLVQNRFDVPKLSMDTTLWNLAHKFASSTDKTKSHYAKLLLESLPKAHSADADILNLTYMLQLTPDLKKRIVKDADSAPIIVVDIETTGVDNDEIYQLAVRLLDEQGNDTGVYNTYHIAVSKTPDDTTLNKLTQAYILNEGETPAQWFERTYIRGKNPEIQTYTSMFDALQDFQNKYMYGLGKAPLFVGHNFRRFDMPRIIQSTRYNPKLKQFFKDARIFDTYEYMLGQHVWQLDELTRQNLTAKLRRVFEQSSFLQDGNPKHSLITYVHLQDLSELKRILKEADEYIPSAKPNAVLATIDTPSDVFKDIDGTVVSFQDTTHRTVYERSATDSGFDKSPVAELFDNGIQHIRDAFSKVSGSNLSARYTTSKTVLNPDEYAKLYADGVVNIPYMQNIMSMLNAGIINEDAIILNPRTLFSYEFTNYFDAQKIIDDYAVSDIKKGHVPISVLQKVTKINKTLTNIRNGLTATAIQKALPQAKEFLSTFSNTSGVLKYLYNTAEMSDTTLVTVALYCKQQFSDTTELAHRFNLLDFESLYKSLDDASAKSFDKDYLSFNRLRQDAEVRYNTIKTNWDTERQMRQRIRIVNKEERTRRFDALYTERSEAWRIRKEQAKRLRQYKANIIQGERDYQLRRKVRGASDAARKIWAGELGDAADLERLVAQAADDPLVAFRDLYEDKGLYSTVKRAKATLYGETHTYTRAWYDLIKDSTPEQQTELFKQLKEVDVELTNLARNHILERPDRVNAFKREARLTGGRVIVATDKPVSLSDFEQDEDLVTLIIPVQLEQTTPYRNPDLDIKLEGTEFNILKDDVQYKNYTPLEANIVYLNFIGVKASAYQDVVVTPKALSKAQLELYDKAGVTYRFVESTTDDGNKLYKYYLNGAEDLPDDVWNSAVFVQNHNRDTRLNNIVEKVRAQFSSCVPYAGCSTGDMLTVELMNQLDKFIVPGVAEQLMPTHVLQSSGFFNKLRANNMIIGSPEVQRLFNTYYSSNIINRTSYTVKQHIDSHIDNLTILINFLCNKENGLDTQDVFKNLANADLRALAKKHKSDWALVYVTECGKYDKTASGFVVHEITDFSDASLNAARKVNAHFVPRESAYELMQAINQFEIPGWIKPLQQLSLGYRLGYLGTIGTVVRNLIDSNYKNHIDDPHSFTLPLQLKRFEESYKYISNYNNIMVHYTNRCGNVLTDVQDYQVLWRLCKGSTEEITQILNRTDRFATVLKRMQMHFTDEDIAYFNKYMLSPDLFELVHGFISNGPSAGLSQKILNELMDSGANKSLLNYITKKTPLAHLYNANEMVEQTARFAKYIEELETGKTVSEAALSVIKTHFDYSDKSLAMLYTELVFPFMSFSFKNLNYWLDTITKNSAILFELENILSVVLDYNSLFDPDYEAYEAYDYAFDFKDDVLSFSANAPWQTINAARLYHILSGNVVIDTDKTVRYDNGYGEQDAELFAVFKLSPSVLDAVRMLYNPIDTYQQRLLPPYEVLSSTFLNILNGKAPVEDVGINAFLNQLPFIGAAVQRAGIGNNNNIARRVQDLGLPAAVSSLFTAAYVPQKKHVYLYDENYNVLNPKATYPRFNKMYYRGGGFSMNYLARRTYSSIYTPDVPTYRITKYARRLPNKSPYRKFKRTQVKLYYFNSLHYGMRDKLIKYRVADKFRHYD